MSRYRNRMFLILLAAALGVGYATFTANDLRAFAFRIQGDDARKAGDQWVLTESPSSATMIYLEFNVQMGRHQLRGNTFPVIVRRLVGGNFDLVKHDATHNEETWDFDNGRSVRLFWSCEPIHNSATKVHAVAVEYKRGQQVSTLCQTIILTLSPRAA